MAEMEATMEDERIGMTDEAMKVIKLTAKLEAMQQKHEGALHALRMNLCKMQKLSNKALKEEFLSNSEMMKRVQSQRLKRKELVKEKKMELNKVEEANTMVTNKLREDLRRTEVNLQEARECLLKARSALQKEECLHRETKDMAEKAKKCAQQLKDENSDYVDEIEEITKMKELAEREEGRLKLLIDSQNSWTHEHEQTTETKLKEAEDAREALQIEKQGLEAESHGKIADLREELTSLQHELTETIKSRDQASVNEKAAKEDLATKVQLAQQFQDKYEREVLLRTANLQSLSQTKEQLSRERKEGKENKKILDVTKAVLSEERRNMEGKQREVESCQNRNSLLNKELQQIAQMQKSGEKDSLLTEALQQTVAREEELGKSSEQLLEVIKLLRQDQEKAVNWNKVTQSDCKRLEQQLEEAEENIRSLTKEKQASQTNVQKLLESLNWLQDSNRLMRKEKNDTLYEEFKRNGKEVPEAAVKAVSPGTQEAASPTANVHDSSGGTSTEVQPDPSSSMGAAEYLNITHLTSANKRSREETEDSETAPPADILAKKSRVHGAPWQAVEPPPQAVEPEDVDSSQPEANANLLNAEMDKEYDDEAMKEGKEGQEEDDKEEGDVVILDDVDESVDQPEGDTVPGEDAMEEVEEVPSPQQAATPVLQVPSPVQARQAPPQARVPNQPGLGSTGVAPFVLGGESGFNDDADIEPSTSTLIVQRRTDGFAGAVLSPQVQQSFQLEVGIDGMPQDGGQLASQAYGVDVTKMDQSQYVDPSPHSASAAQSPRLAPSISATKPSPPPTTEGQPEEKQPEADQSTTEGTPADMQQSSDLSGAELPTSQGATADSQEAAHEGEADQPGGREEGEGGDTDPKASTRTDTSGDQGKPTKKVIPRISRRVPILTTTTAPPPPDAISPIQAVGAQRGQAIRGNCARRGNSGWFRSRGVSPLGMKGPMAKRSLKAKPKF